MFRSHCRTQTISRYQRERDTDRNSGRVHTRRTSRRLLSRLKCDSSHQWGLVEFSVSTLHSLNPSENKCIEVLSAWTNLMNLLDAFHSGGFVPTHDTASQMLKCQRHTREAMNSGTKDLLWSTITKTGNFVPFIIASHTVQTQNHLFAWWSWLLWQNRHRLLLDNPSTCFAD